MFDYIEGKLIEKNPAYAVIDVNGIGYGANISLNTYSALKKDSTTRLYTHVSFKIENTNPIGIDIIGFFDKKERTFFRHLISVNRIGNNIALVMLSSMKPDEIHHAIATEDVKKLQTIKGIGAKAAQRIIMDLKDKLGKDGYKVENSVFGNNLNKQEALSGLVMLGFNKNLAEKTLDKMINQGGDTLSVEELIKQTLKIL